MTTAMKPLIRKLGTIDCDLVETTPVVYNGHLAGLKEGTGLCAKIVPYLDIGQSSKRYIVSF